MGADRPPLMLWIWIGSALVILGFLALGAGLLPPPRAATLIRVRSGKPRVIRGPMRPDATEQVGAILRGAGVSRGFIAITSQNRVAFSRTIPARVHQRLRNVILNQWA